MIKTEYGQYHVLIMDMLMNKAFMITKIKEYLKILVKQLNKLYRCLDQDRRQILLIRKGGRVILDALTD